MKTFQEITAVLTQNLPGTDQQNLLDFEELVVHLKKSVAAYSSTNWSTLPPKQVYRFGEVFKVRDATEYINIIQKHTAPNSRIEVLEFVKSEILWNFFGPNGEFTEQYLRELVQLFPYNPEFHHTLSHQQEAKGDFKKALEEARLAFSMAKTNDEFKMNVFNKEAGYINKLILDTKFTEAEAVLQQMEQNEHYKKDAILTSIIIGIFNRLQDHQTIIIRIDDFNKKLESRFNEEYKRAFEILVIICSVLALIFINTNLALRGGTFSEISELMMLVTVTLLSFVLAISFSFDLKGSVTLARSVMSKLPSIFILLLLLLIALFFHFK